MMDGRGWGRIERALVRNRWSTRRCSRTDASVATLPLASAAERQYRWPDEMNVNCRRKELAHFDPELVWLEPAEAALAFEAAAACSSTTRYGLNDATVANIERLDA